MSRKKISAKLAISDIRSGMDDSALMKKYGLAADGIQSLFDKLVAGGYLDLSEVQVRMQGFLGTIVIDDFRKEKLPSAPGRGSRINAQEAARDVRSGTDDFALMDKYRLSSRGLQSMFNKLIAGGLISQLDLDRRSLGIEHTVDLRDDMPSLSQVLRHLGRPAPLTVPEAAAPVQPAPRSPAAPSEQRKIEDVVMNGPERPDDAPKIEDEEIRDVKDDNPPEAGKTPWFDKTALVVLLIIAFFPVGFYGLYRNSTLWVVTKIAITTLWLLIAAVFALAALAPILVAGGPY
jgi:hypothetical protein